MTCWLPTRTCPRRLDDYAKVTCRQIEVSADDYNLSVAFMGESDMLDRQFPAAIPELLRRGVWPHSRAHGKQLQPVLTPSCRSRRH